MLDLDDPIDHYRTHLREEHEQLVREAFEDLVRRSGVDEEENKRIVSDLRSLMDDHGRSIARRKCWRMLRVALLAAAALLVALAFLQKGLYILSLVPASAAILLVLSRVNPKVRNHTSILQDLDTRINETTKEAWAQMAPLNALHTWNTSKALVQKILPAFKFDRHVTAQRVHDLQENFDLSPEYNNGRSIFAADSGTFNGNPFVLARYKLHWMGSRTYRGSLTIKWTETVRNANGDVINQVRTQTLVASVSKPFPEYQMVTNLIYGHEAAPNLSFSRNPSKLSASNAGAVNQKKVERAVKKVERQARKATRTGRGELTVMSNREFEALFKATNRNNEVEFRLLFTPLAQQQMVELMNDTSVGYGDDFSFVKSGRLNFVEPAHLISTTLDDDPARFQTFELARARQVFLEHHLGYFRSLYFSFAPLLTVPLYRDIRSIAGLGWHDSEEVCSEWEHEVIVNHIGEDRFRHPDSVTDNILSAYTRDGNGPTKFVDVVAHGYAGYDRVDYVPMLGGDGNMHAVPVHWVEYIPLVSQSTLLVGPIKSAQLNTGDNENSELRKAWEDLATSHGVDPDNVYVRNGIVFTVIA